MASASNPTSSAPIGTMQIPVHALHLPEFEIVPQTHPDHVFAAVAKDRSGNTQRRGDLCGPDAAHGFGSDKPFNTSHQFASPELHRGLGLGWRARKAIEEGLEQLLLKAMAGSICHERLCPDMRGVIEPDNGDENGLASANLPKFLTEDETAALDA